MNGQTRTLLALAGAVLLVAGAAAEQAKPAAPVTQKPAPVRPNDEGATKAPTRLVAPVRGVAEIGYLAPKSSREGNMIVTKIMVKNLASGAIAGLKVDEFWYDRANELVAGAETFRLRKPLQPGEVVEVVLKVQSNPKMDRNTYKFAHANGDIKATRLQKL